VRETRGENNVQFLAMGLPLARFESGGPLDTGFGTNGLAGAEGLAATRLNRLAVPAGLVAEHGACFGKRLRQISSKYLDINELDRNISTTRNVLTLGTQKVNRLGP